MHDIEAIQLSLSALFAMPRLQPMEEGNLLIASVTSRNEVEKKKLSPRPHILPFTMRG